MAQLHHTAPGARPANSKKLLSHVIQIAAGTPTASTPVVPAQPVQAISVTNNSPNMLRLMLTFVTGVTGNALPSTQCAVIDVGCSYVYDSSDTAGDNAAGTKNAIADFTIDPIDVTVSGNITAATLLASTAEAGRVIVNMTAA